MEAWLSKRQTWAEVDLAALARNYETVRSLLDPASGAAIIPVIKADAYGHGMIPVARALARAGAGMFAVGAVEEGVALRRAGIGQAVVVLATTWTGQEPEALQNGLELAVEDTAQVLRLEAAAAASGSDARVHIKVDTGMGRLGVRWDAMEPLLESLKGARCVRLSGTFSHLSSADEADPGFTRTQARRFESALDQIGRQGLEPGRIHLANSAGFLYHEPLRRWSARIGIALYGYPPDPGRCPVELTPVLSFRTRICAVRRIGAGEPVGYGRRFVSSRPTVVGTLPVGYADGCSRRLAGQGRVIVRDRWADILGTVSMDMITIDLTDLPEARLGDEVILIGASGPCRVTAADWARMLETIPYEVLCRIAGRVPRVPRSGP